MKELGEILKAQRISRGLTLQQVSDRTRLPLNRIRAIEEGDIESFKNDLSYLHFFLRSYCSAIDFDYNEVKQMLQDSVDSYTTSFNKQEIADHEQMERNILEKAKEKPKRKQLSQPKKYARRQIDFSMISFLFVVVLVVASAIFVGGYYLTRPEPDPQPVVPPVVDKPQEDKPSGEEEEIPVPEMIVTKRDANHYDIENATETVKIKIEFTNNSWFMGTIDGVQMKDPQVNKIYTTGEVITVEMDSLTQKQCSLRFGYFIGTKITVNEQEIEFDESIKNTNVQEIVFEIGGASNESAE